MIEVDQKKFQSAPLYIQNAYQSFLKTIQYFEKKGFNYGLRKRLEVLAKLMNYAGSAEFFDRIDAALSTDKLKESFLCAIYNAYEFDSCLLYEGSIPENKKALSETLKAITTVKNSLKILNMNNWGVLLLNNKILHSGFAISDHSWAECLAKSGPQAFDITTILDRLYHDVELTLEKLDSSMRSRGIESEIQYRVISRLQKFFESSSLPSNLQLIADICNVLFDTEYNKDDINSKQQNINKHKDFPVF